jgi:hypothetical protein
MLTECCGRRDRISVPSGWCVPGGWWPYCSVLFGGSPHPGPGDHLRLTNGCAVARGLFDTITTEIEQASDHAAIWAEIDLA